jgi:hypothetical protein
MAISQRGARYEHQAEIEAKDPILGKALAHLASQIEAVRLQGNYGERGEPQKPTGPQQLSISVSSSFFTWAILHTNPPAGTRYILQYSTSPSFLSPVTEEIGSSPGIPTSIQRYLPGLHIYSRVAAKFPASGMTPWVYFGSAASPTRIG